MCDVLKIKRSTYYYQSFEPECDQEHELVLYYMVTQYIPQKTEPNEEAVENALDRNFNDQQESAVVVSDLTYVRINNDGLMYVSLSTYLTGKSLVIVLGHKM